MRSGNARAEDRRDGAARDDGSLLVEVVIGIGLSALLVAGLGPAHRAVADAVGRAEHLTAAVRAAESVLEAQHAVGGIGDDVVGSATLIDPTEPVAGCGGALPADLRRRAIDVGPERSVGDGRVRLEGLVRPDGTAEDAEGVLRVHVPHLPPLEGGSIAVVQDGAEHLRRIATGTPCADFTGLGPGTVAVHATSDGAPWLDRTQVRLVDRPAIATLTESTSVAVVDAAPSMTIAVTADHAGARPPDVVGPSGLRWFVRGDDARTATDLGLQRAVRQGSVTVVVSACGDPEAPSSARRVEHWGPGPHVIDVPLARVVLRDVAGRGDATLLALRTTPCADGAGLRPSLRWDAGLFDGLRIALPHGEWEVRLQTSTGSPLTFPVLVRAGEDEELELP